MPLNDVLRVGVHYTVDAQKCMNVRDYRVSQAGIDFVAEELALANFWLNTAVPSLVGGISSSASIFAVSVRRIRPTVGPQTDFTLPSPTPGTRGPDMLPNFVAGICSLRTPNVGKRRRGRFYLPGIAENDTNASRYTATGFTAFTNAVAFLNDVITGTGTPPPILIPVVFSRRAEQLGQFTTSDIVVLIPREELATMRSRKVGVGS